MAHRPLILATASLTTYLGETAFRLCENYADAIVRAGGLPVVLPLTERIDVYDEYLDRADGLMLTGGADIEPARYRSALERCGVEALSGERLVGETTPLRDAAELHLLFGAEQRGLPILGICRGAQIMNIAHGGTLYHDLDAQHAPASGALAIVHNEYMDGRISHTVEIKGGSVLGGILGESELAVNSLHHQAIRDLGAGYTASAIAPDGVIEAIEHLDAPFMLGVQWHPEYHASKEPMARLFNRFVEACAQAS